MSYKDMIDSGLRVDQDLFALIVIDLKEWSFQSDLVIFIELVALYGPIGYLRQGCSNTSASLRSRGSQSLKDRLNHTFQV